MPQQKDYHNLSNHLRTAIGMLDLPAESRLRKDVMAICDYVENPTFSIAVFGPFNYGKSTLLNALLGRRTLPIDLIPTTGAVIQVRYGEQLRSRIIFKDGTEINEPGTEVLKRYAILDDRRCMRSDVARIEVFCCHPFLKTGVELIDLPGTNDQEAQDDLVRDRLLSTDLIIQVLDARKLMTLGERENLRDWLQERGINTVVFVVNFLNLLDPDEQKAVQQRLRFVAESFRSQLGDGISNLYRVDALPALRARLKGDTSAAQTSGLTTFESALQTIVTNCKQKSTTRLPRVLEIAQQIKPVIQDKINAIAKEIEQQQQRQQDQVAIKQKAQKLIQQGWQSSISELESWLYLPKLLSRYQTEVSLCLQQGTLELWEIETLQPAVLSYQTKIEEWVVRSYKFFEQEYPQELSLSFPPIPQFTSTQPINNNNSSDNSESGNFVSVAIPTGLGWALGGPVGAVVLGSASYLFNKSSKKVAESDTATNDQTDRESQIYLEAAKAYLTQFSQDAFSTLNHYQERVSPIINFAIQTNPLEFTTTHHQLNLFKALLENLELQLLPFCP